MAQQLIMKEDLLERLVNFCLNSDHPGVRAESPRLLAWLIKHCHSSDAYPKLVTVKDCVRCLVEMIPSSHGVMQNEALYALNILCAFETVTKEKNTEKVTELSQDIDNLQINNHDLKNILVECDIGKYITFLLNKYGEKMEKEIIENMVLFLEKLCVSSEVQKNLKKNDVQNVMKKILDRKDCNNLSERVDKICLAVESG